MTCLGLRRPWNWHSAHVHCLFTVYHYGFDEDFVFSAFEKEDPPVEKETSSAAEESEFHMQ